MDLCFLRATPSEVIGEVIAKATGGPFCHCETRFSDGRTFSSQYGEGVRWKDAEFGRSLDADPNWEVIKTPWPETPAIVTWCDSIVGQPYDVLGAVNSGFGLDVHLAGHWFCSETANEILSRVPVAGLLALPNPNGLYWWACEQLGIPSKVSRTVQAAPVKLVGRDVAGPLNGLNDAAEELIAMAKSVEATMGMIQRVTATIDGKTLAEMSQTMKSLDAKAAVLLQAMAGIDAKTVAELIGRANLIAGWAVCRGGGS